MTWMLTKVWQPGCSFPAQKAKSCQAWDCMICASSLCICWLAIKTSALALRVPMIWFLLGLSHDIFILIFGGIVYVFKLLFFWLVVVINGPFWVLYILPFLWLLVPRQSVVYLPCSPETSLCSSAIILASFVVVINTMTENNLGEGRAFSYYRFQSISEGIRVGICGGNAV